MEQIKLDIVPVGVAPVAHASQFDNGRQIRFNLFNQGTPYTLTGAETVTMMVNGEEENITNTSDNYIVWDVAEEDCAEVGVIGCEIRIVLGSMLIGSKNFFLEVEMDPYDGKNVRIVTVGPADICTFETTLPEPLQSVTVDVEATGGNGTPDSPIPINGYTEANITRCGVNLWDEEWELGYFNTANGQPLPISDRIRSKNFIPIKPETAFRLVIPSSHYIMPLFYDKDKNYLGYIANGVYISYQNPFTSLANACYMKFYVSPSYGTTYNNDISINYPSTDTTYHPYNGQTYAIAFGQTVYGGQLIILPDRTYFHVTHKIVDLGDLNWINENDTQTGLCRSNAQFTDCVWQSVMICSAYNYNPTTSYNGLSDGNIALTNSESIPLLRIRNTDYSSYTNAQIKEAVTGMKLVYQTKTPFDIDLTPVQISALVGENNVFADCGQTTVEYLDEE